MINEPKQHHFIPQCYLRGFLSNNVKKQTITVIDLNQRKSFGSNIRNVGGKRYFNKAKIEGKDTCELESILSKVEDIIIKGLKQIEKDQNLSNEESNNIIFNLMAIIVARNPNTRLNLVNFQKQITQHFLKIMVSNKDTYENLKKRSKITDDLPYDQMKEFIQSDRHRIEVPNECCIPLEFKSIDVILPLLSKRGWELAISSEKTGPFVTSDYPVVLNWKHPEKIPLFNRAHPGFGMPDTTVQFPISKHLALTGEFEFTDKVHFADINYVSDFNRKTIRFASPQVYAPDLNFYFKNDIGQMCFGADYFKDWF